jgi:hypothetical protein
MGVLSFLYDHLRTFENILVHPSQEMRAPDGTFFRGGPEWPHFATQVFARHCRGAIPRPIDSAPLPALPDWPYYDPQVFLALFGPEDRRKGIAALADVHAPLSGAAVERADEGIWCGPIILHFGQMIADFGMRIAASGRIDPAMPLVFTMPPLRDIVPAPYFWEIIDHLGVDRGRVLLVRKPTRFGRLYVLPQAERLFSSGPSRRHLRLMDEITKPSAPSECDLDCVYVSRALLPEGRFAGEPYLDAILTAAGVTVFHPETVDVQAQLRLYRRARRLIFSEGSAMHALQLLGHLESDIAVLARRPGYRLAAANLRPRARSLRYLQAARGLVPTLSPAGHPVHRAGISVLDEAACIAGFRSIGIELAGHWDSRAYAERRDADIAAWLAYREAAGTHPDERAIIERHLRALRLPA